MDATSSNASVNIAYAARLREIEGLGDAAQARYWRDREAALLELFMARPGRVLSKEQIALQLADYDALRARVAALRAELDITLTSDEDRRLGERPIADARACLARICA